MQNPNHDLRVADAHIGAPLSGECRIQNEECRIKETVWRTCGKADYIEKDIVYYGYVFF